MLKGTFAKALIAASLMAMSATAAYSKDGSAALVNLELQDLRARYTLPNSKFVQLNGVDIHYVEKGTGPVVLLLHGSYLDLTGWQPWEDELARDHRVIRVDRLSQGLTGEFKGEPVNYAQEQRMLDAFLEYLKIDKFALVGTSSGGITAAQLADRHPDKVEKLILMNFPLGHGRIGKSDPGARQAPRVAPPANQTPLEASRWLLERNLVDKSVITPLMVERMTAFGNRRDDIGARAASFANAASFTEEQRAAMLGRLKMPSLVIWSSENNTLPLSAGKAAFEAIGSTQKDFVLMENVGHMMPLEKGAESAVIARKFFEGKPVQ